MKKSFGYPIIFMTLITVVYVAVLSTFNFITADTISFNKESDLRYKILYIFDILPEEENAVEVEKVFNERVVQKQFKENLGYALLENGKETAYAIPFDGAGLWGLVTGYMGLNQDYTKIIGIEFVTQSETPGLGGRISEEFYKKQFRNIDISTSSQGNYIISSPALNSNVDAIAGATLTSMAVVKLLNEDLTSFLDGGR